MLSLLGAGIGRYANWRTCCVATLYLDEIPFLYRSPQRNRIFTIRAAIRDIEYRADPIAVR